MSYRIDLVWTGTPSPPRWPEGAVYALPTVTPREMDSLLRSVTHDTEADAVLIWDSRLGSPRAAGLRELLDGPGDAWHAGLRLGLGGLPSVVDYVHPVWMLNRDPDPEIEATSWRVSLRACLVRTEVLRALGGPSADFDSMEGAGLEMGHRYIHRGAVVRHAAARLGVEEEPSQTRVDLPPEDELRFALYRFGRKWALWSLMRAVAGGDHPRREWLRAWRTVRGASTRGAPPSLRADLPAPSRMPTGRVTVLIPTIDRYPYLRTVLAQLRDQTVPPLEILVVDQTPAEGRDRSFEEEFSDLPLTALYRDEPGQCSSRNAGLVRAIGDYVLFLDDDDEIEPDLIERHLACLAASGADVSAGVAEEAGAGPLPPEFRLIRVSDVFPTNNTMIRREVLARSGLFDLAYDRGQRADLDLGMRIYLSGALMILNPHISVFHHHAPRGGLRVHGARIVTYASSRSTLLHRNLPSASELYLARRYFSERQTREMVWQRIVGTLSARGGSLRRLRKLAVSLGLLPDSIAKVRARKREATQLASRFPDIPPLSTPR